MVIARDVGVSEAQIEAASPGSGPGGAPLAGDDALVCRFTEEVVRDVSPCDATFAAAAARFSTREIVELLLVIGQYMLVERLAATARIDPDPPAGRSLLGALPGGWVAPGVRFPSIDTTPAHGLRSRLDSTVPCRQPSAIRSSRYGRDVHRGDSSL